MSKLLKKPVREKFRGNGGNERFDYGVSAMQGYRPKMEDAHVTLENLDAASATSFFAIYDGHGGPAVAKYCANHLHTDLCANEEFHSNLTAALENTFLRMDVMMSDQNAKKELSKYRGFEGLKTLGRKLLHGYFFPCVKKPAYMGPLYDGCTACVVLIRDNQIIVANAGDSRCVISVGGQARELSRDHKPNVESETQRIQRAGHEVTRFQGRGPAFRIDAGIATSRAIGDLRYKDNTRLGPREQALTALPEVRNEVITGDTEFLIIACDGIWDCFSSQDVVDYIRQYINYIGLADICASLLDLCLASPSGVDNMSVILIKFKRPAQRANTHSAQLSPRQPIQANPDVSGTAPAPRSLNIDVGTAGSGKAPGDSQHSEISEH